MLDIPGITEILVFTGGDNLWPDETVLDLKEKTLSSLL